MQITRLGHAALLVETPYVRILIDPGGFTTGWHGLADLDAVLITHQHHDHVDAPNIAELMKLNPTTQLRVEPEVVPMLEEHGLAAEAVSPGETLEVGPAKVEVVGGTHALIHENIPRVGNVGFLISEADGPRLFHPGDSYDYTPPSVDILALPLTAPWARAGTTGDFLAAVAAPEAFPIHDAIASETGRATYLRIVGNIGAEGVTFHHLSPDGSLNV